MTYIKNWFFFVLASVEQSPALFFVQLAYQKNAFQSAKKGENSFNKTFPADRKSGRFSFLPVARVHSPEATMSGARLGLGLFELVSFTHIGRKRRHERIPLTHQLVIHQCAVFKVHKA